MADPSLRERLQPALLDRLTDDERGKRLESRDKRVISPSQLRRCVLRDLSWLLNTSALSNTEDLDDYDEIRASVLNYGIVDLAGSTNTGLDLENLEKKIREAIWNFEPRILRNSLRVSAVIDPDEMSYNALVFEIEGELWGQPLTQRLFMRTEIDLESGQVKVTESQDGGGG